METIMENIRKEVATEYPEGIFARADLAFIYKDILNQDLQAGRKLTIRLDWCNQDKFVVNYMISDSFVSDYKNYRKLSKEEFVEKLMEDTMGFALGTRNSIVDIHFATGENHDLYYMYSQIRNDPRSVSNHKKNCGEGFLVYTPNQHGITEPEKNPAEEDLSDEPVQEALEEGFSDEPEEEAVEEEKEGDIGLPAPMPLLQEDVVDKLMEEETKKKEAKMNENNLIVKKIEDVISELKKIEKRNVYDNKQFSKVTKKYEEMKTYIDEYIKNDLINYETNIKDDSELKRKYDEFKTKWETYFAWRLNNQYSFLTEKYSDTVSFLRKRNDFIYMLKELRNYINVNLFGKPAVLGGKTKRRYRKKTIRKRMAKKQTKKFRRIR